MDRISSVVAVEAVVVMAMVVVAIVAVVVVVPVIVVAVMVLSGWVTWCHGEYGGGFLSDGLLVQCIVHSQCLGGVCNTIDKLLIDPTWK